jgi:predicted AAA+ superfamily ATPase
MKHVFKQLILDFQNQIIPYPTPRDLSPFSLPKGMRKAVVLVGMRRSGKTWSLYQQMHRLLDNGLDRRHLLYLNFEDDRLIGTTLQDLQAILEAYFELFPELLDSKDIHFFFDEIHEIPGWEHFVRRLLDNESIRIYLTGSSAKMLSKEIATSLRGRTLVREVFPYNFHEYLQHLKVKFEGPLTSKRKASLNYHALEYLKWGGFPEVVGIDRSFHREILQSYVDTVIYRDIVERYKIAQVHVLRRLLSHCLQNPASSFSVNKMYQSLKSQGLAITKNALYDFMEYFEDAYCLFSVPAFNLSARKSSLKPKKIYPVDPGLITAYALERDYQQEPALESLVFSVLKRAAKELYYFVTKRGLEVDFFASYPNNSRQLVQVSLSLQNNATYDREVKALREAMQETGLKESFIITLDEEEEIEIDEGMIHVIPLLHLLLGSIKV